MKLNRFLAVLTLINMLTLLFLLVQGRSAAAQSELPVLRGRALEIVDNKGQVRASLTIEPAVTSGTRTTYPETVLLRMGDPKLRPVVKLAASELGSGLQLWDGSAPVLLGNSASGNAR